MSGTAACLCGTCPSCAGGSAAPAPVADPVRYRHSAILHRMLDRIGSTEIGGGRPLAHLATKENDDPAVALVDAFAGGLHILAWNARRLGDDATIGRTEDRDALVDLTALVGYRPRPALAANTTLAFTLDGLPSSPRTLTVPQGAQVASIPGPNEKPQTFETDAAIEARVEWNLLKPVLPDLHQEISEATHTIVLASAATAAKVGDMVFVWCTDQTVVQPGGGKPAKQGLKKGGSPQKQAQQQQPGPQQTPQPPGPVWLGASHRWLVARVAAVRRIADPPTCELDLTDGAALVTEAILADGDAGDLVIVAGQRAAAFGAVAPDPSLLPAEIQAKLATAGQWKNFVIAKGSAIGGTLDLDAVYADAVPGRAILFATTGRQQLGVVTAAHERSRAAFALSAKCSRIGVAGINFASSGSSFRALVRETGMFLETARERLRVVSKDIALPDAGTPDRIAFQPVPALAPGRRVVLKGRDFTTGEAAAEVATVRESKDAGGSTILKFEKPLATRFHGIGLVAYGNAAPASHGATPASGAETLGSGDGSTRTPRFTLKGKPLAYVAAPNPRGYAPALEVRVAGRRYDEAATLYGRTPGERVYTVRTGREETTGIQFAGTLPRGDFNVTALYRLGGGLPGNLAPGRLTMMMSPLLGVGGVANPVPAEGGSDAETTDAMRTAAPQSIRTLDRVVALEDYEAFARAYRGVGKAMATELFQNMRRLVCLTIASTDLKPPTPGGDLVTDLAKAVLAAAPPGRSIIVAGFDDIVPTIALALAVDTAFLRKDVEAAVRAALGDAFSRAARPFSQALHRSAILAAVQSVPGVTAARLTGFSTPAGPPEQDGRLFAPAPAWTGGKLVRAGLLAVDPAAVAFSEMKP